MVQEEERILMGGAYRAPLLKQWSAKALETNVALNLFQGPFS